MFSFLHSFLPCRKRSSLPLHNEICGAVRAGGGGGRGCVPAEGGSRLHQGSHQAGAEHTPNPQGRGDPEGRVLIDKRRKNRS